MEAERKRVANELRSEGSAEAEKIRADADRQREVIVAEAYRDAQKIKGEGDAKATNIYAQAFARIPSSMPSTAASKPIAAASRARAMCWSSSRIPNSSST
jgi:regulator of protease activity HflC (stomatin/prohibitin superfamily)